MESSEAIGGNLPERITKRHRKRKNVIEKKREEKQQLAVGSEQLSYFEDTFHGPCNKVREMLELVESMQSSSLPGLFDKVNTQISTLWNYLSQSKIYLTTYEVRKAQEALQHLETETTELELKYLPQKKFGFRNRIAMEKPSKKTLDVTDGLKDMNLSDSITNGAIKQQKELTSMYPDNASTLIGKVDEEVTLDAENVNKKDVFLSDLTRCTVKICGAPSTLHMVNIKRCTILVGPVSASVFAHNCEQSTFAFACQQLRLHSSINCTIYLHVTSRAIMEDCSEMKVAPYNWVYEGQASHFNLAGLDTKTNNWDSVNDFNWLCDEKHSPNWAILEPELRVESWD